MISELKFIQSGRVILVIKSVSINDLRSYGISHTYLSDLDIYNLEMFYCIYK